MLTCSRRCTSSKGGRLVASVSQHSIMRFRNPSGMVAGMFGRHPISTLKNTCKEPTPHGELVTSNCTISQPSETQHNGNDL